MHLWAGSSAARLRARLLAHLGAMVQQGKVATHRCKSTDRRRPFAVRASEGRPANERSAIPVERAREAVREFVATGRRSAGVVWEEEPE